MNTALTEDLNHILAHTDGLWDELRNQRIFITGGTGFFGCWLLESLAWANEQLRLQAQAVVLTRNPGAFERKAPHLAGNPAIRLQTGNVRSFDFPDGEFRFVVHAATETDDQPMGPDALQLFEDNTAGVKRVLEFTRACKATKFLLTSSGAVYGCQPADLTHIPEDYPGAPDPTRLQCAYGQGKRVAEFMAVGYAQRYGLQVKIARCFAFVGPYFPLNAHYAIGNFIRDALASGPIRVEGDGTPWRSYLYAADLAVWLWTILFRGASCRPYNVGSDRAVTIQELANEVASVADPQLKVEIARQPVPGAPAARYVPSIDRARAELSLQVWIPRADAIRRMIVWPRGS